MTIRQVTPQLFIGNVADFGDAQALNAAGIELAVLCHGWTAFPHSATVGALAVNITSNASHPAWMVRGMAKLLGVAYGVKKMCICDQSGGLNEAAYLIAASVAEYQTISFDAGLAWLKARISDASPTPALVSQGRSLWP